MGQHVPMEWWCHQGLSIAARLWGAEHAEPQGPYGKMRFLLCK